MVHEEMPHLCQSHAPSNTTAPRAEAQQPHPPSSSQVMNSVSTLLLQHENKVFFPPFQWGCSKRPLGLKKATESF